MSANLLYYDAPAPEWIEGMPLGNGHLGAMVLGKPVIEQIVLNEDTIWSASAGNRNNPDSYAHLQEIRDMLLGGQYAQASMLADAALMGTPRKQARYQPLGELHMEFLYPPTASPLGYDVGSYCRTLDLASATAQVAFARAGVRHQREYFTSAADNTLVARFWADAPAMQSCTVGLYRHFNAVLTTQQEEGANTAQITLVGQADIGGVRFCAKLALAAEGAQASVQLIGEKILVKNADAVTLRLVAETDYHGDEVEIGLEQAAQQRLDAVATKSYQALRDAHVAEYRSYYDVMSFEVMGDAAQAAPANSAIDARLRRVQGGARDVELAATYFNFGRYLLISCSRPGTMAANLQGIWCNETVPMWDSKYTININTQMNYWPAQVCGLAPCHRPLLDMVAALRENGRVTAREMYHCRGFVVHHNTDGWFDTAPLDQVDSGIWPMGGAWLSLSMWDYYDYTGDVSFLMETGYPVMQEAAVFFLDYMFEQDGQLLTGPSLSPENYFIAKDGTLGNICCSPAMDTQLLTALFTRCQKAAAVLGIADEFTDAITDALPKLPPLQIAPDGRLQEWREDYAEREMGHRHLSHLFAVYPEWQINAKDTPELFAASRKSLETRLAHGGGGTGWSLAWLLALWARFGEGEQAAASIDRMLATSTQMSLLDIHPPRIFQIDGNLGMLSAMAELLMQARDGSVTLFPALPSAWKEGRVTGLCAPHGLVLDLVWQCDGKATAVLRAKRAVTVLLDCPRGDFSAQQLNLAAGEETSLSLVLKNC